MAIGGSGWISVSGSSTGGSSWWLLVCGSGGSTGGSPVDPSVDHHQWVDRHHLAHLLVDLLVALWALVDLWVDPSVDHHQWVDQCHLAHLLVDLLVALWALVDLWWIRRWIRDGHWWLRG